jgi:hypothetical protein
MIDLNDYIVKETLRKKPRFKGEISRHTYYRCACPKCNLDKGYIRKSRYMAKPMCIKCATNTPIHKDNLKKSHWSKTGTYVPPQPSSETLKIRKEKELEYCRVYGKNYYKINKKDINLKRKKFEINNLNHRLAKRLRSRLVNAIAMDQKSGSAVFDLGCSISELKLYLESKFLPGMTWENWSRTGWHIDHIKPLSKVNLSKREELLKACHYTNLQPLWAKDNLKKSDKQPFL